MECTYSACVTLFASICSTDIVKPNDYSRRHKKNAMSRKSPLKYVAFHLQHVALRADLEVSILKKMSRFAPRTEGIISSASRFVRQEQHCFLRVYVLGCVWKQASIYQFAHLLFMFCSRCYKNQYYCIYILGYSCKDPNCVPSKWRMMEAGGGYRLVTRRWPG